MSVFDARRLRNHLRRNASRVGCTMRELVEVYDDGIANTKVGALCVAMSELVGIWEKLTPEKIAHSKECKYCQRLLRFIVLLDMPVQKLEAIIDAIALDRGTATEEILETFKESRTNRKESECLSFVQLLRYGTFELSDPMRQKSIAHRNRCTYCSTLLELVERMDDIELAPS